MKGIILAGGYGTRLLPLSKYINKHLIPINGKPMIYYPLATLLQMGINEILIITNSKDKHLFFSLLGDGKQLGCRFYYQGQNVPQGTGSAFQRNNRFIKDDKIAMILGDNIFGNFNYKSASEFIRSENGSLIYPKKVGKPNRYGIVELNSNNEPISIEEKPVKPKSDYAITGLYLFNESLLQISKQIKKSDRGEYEITDIIKRYLLMNQLSCEIVPETCFWFDAGTFSSLERASSVIHQYENTLELKIGCIEEVALKQSFINKIQLRIIAEKLKASEYGQYLLNKY